MNEFTRCRKGPPVYVFIENQRFIDISPAEGGNIAVKKLHGCIFQVVVLRYLGNKLLDADIIKGCNVIGIEGGQILSNGIAALQEFRQNGLPHLFFDNKDRRDHDQTFQHDNTKQKLAVKSESYSFRICWSRCLCH